MKKGFTMIELIFVIVILGILASVAIPRLASTRTDAEITATIGNLRTLMSDLADYYTVTGEFGANDAYGAVTNVPLRTADGDLVTDVAMVGNTANAYLPIGRAATCIGVHVVNRNGDIPAHLQFTTNTGNDAACATVINARAVQMQIANAIQYRTVDANGASTIETIENALPIGPTAVVYPEAQGQSNP